MTSEREIDLTPNFENLFAQFERELRLKCDSIVSDLDWGEPVDRLRVVQHIMACVNMCAQCTTSLGHVVRLRELFYSCLQRIDAKIQEAERREQQREVKARKALRALYEDRPDVAGKQHCCRCDRKIGDVEYLVDDDGMVRHFCCPVVQS